MADLGRVKVWLHMRCRMYVYETERKSVGLREKLWGCHQHLEKTAHFVFVSRI